MKNISSGIFILNKDEIEKDDLEVIEFRARVIIDSSKEDIGEYIREHEDRECKEEIKREKHDLITSIGVSLFFMILCAILMLTLNHNECNFPHNHIILYIRYRLYESISHTPTIHHNPIEYKKC